MTDTILQKLKTDIENAPLEKQKLICWLLYKEGEQIMAIKKKMAFNLTEISERGIKTIKDILYKNKIDMEPL